MSAAYPRLRVLGMLPRYSLPAIEDAPPGLRYQIAQLVSPSKNSAQVRGGSPPTLFIILRDGRRGVKAQAYFLNLRLLRSIISAVNRRLPATVLWSGSAPQRQSLVCAGLVAPALQG